LELSWLLSCYVAAASPSLAATTYGTTTNQINA
jgi:hypothetical protein